MTDLTLAPEAMTMIEEHFDVDYRPPDHDALVKIIGGYDYFWGHVDLKVDTPVLERAERLKAINTSSTGTDHLDKEEMKKRGIKLLCIAEDYSLLDTFMATAECAWMLLLACCRHFRSASRGALDGDWRNCFAYLGRQLSQRTLGVLGVGRLGKMTVEYGKAFRMRVLGCDLKPFSIDGVEPVDFETLLRESDAISIHVHMTPENYHLFDAEVFARMKDGAVLVNTSRGDVIDEEALLAALESGRLAAFGADVLHDEWRPDMRRQPVVQYAKDHDNVVLTPHIGGGTFKSFHDARVFSAKKLVHYDRTGEELRMP